MNKIRVGITFIGYECMELMPKALEPWFQIRNDSSLVPEIKDLWISLSHGCFEETAKLGFPILSTDGSAEWMKKAFDDGKIDNVIIYPNPMKEFDMWTGNYLDIRNGIDLLIMINHDEMWTIEEIRRLFIFINFNPLADYYKINFKNYCIDEKTWVDDFIVPRVWWVNRNKKLKGFYKDELVEYEDGKKDFQCSFAVAPQTFLFPKHFSWVGSESYLKRKLNFQALRFGSCSYSWDEKNNKLQLNEDFYAKMRIPKPTLHHE